MSAPTSARLEVLCKAGGSGILCLVAASLFSFLSRWIFLGGGGTIFPQIKQERKEVMNGRFAELGLGQ